ncbi:MAG: hypothetical protein AMS18_00395 [Gemmatimonas sp. SG8_17]|nr:MAG: hypothetical protein AMS18_00395 [Gemmatimonas sp. SG8_17]
MMLPVLVLAGQRDQMNAWAEENDIPLEHLRFVHTGGDLVGVYGYRVTYVGEYFTNPMAGFVYDSVARRRLEPLDQSEVKAWIDEQLKS